ncbi:MAG: ATP-binding protein, partial [Bdellovibrionota bacterium]|nr:ATP-binding protein [Bdellovibrionota bacterium]
KVWDIFNKNQNLIKKWVQTIWEGHFNFKDIVGLGPNIFQGTKGKFIRIDYRPIYHKDNKTIEKVIMVASDKTKEKELEDKIERDKEEAFFIKICLQDPEDFLDLMNDTYSFLLDYPSITNHKEEKERIFRYFHTMKARYGQFHLSEIAKILNVLEDLLEKEDWKNLNIQMEILDKEINNLFSKHGLLVQAANKLLIDEGGAVRIKELFSELDNFENLDTFKKYIQTNYILKDFKSAFKKFEALVEDLSKEQNKSIVFELRGDNILVNIDHYQDFISSSIHLFRNIVDHGIESKETRLKINKNEFGTIIIKSQNINNKIILTIEDDGGGINPIKIKEKLIEKNLKTSSELSNLNDKEILDFIFLTGFSTAEKVGPLSGRGVGTDAVRYEVNNLGGTISVDSELGVKTIFTIILPII